MGLHSPRLGTGMKILSNWRRQSLHIAKSLKERTRERVPMEWAETQTNLGNALWRLGEREKGTARLQTAIAAHRAALLEHTRERAPLDWAMTQNNLGNALRTLGEREKGTARLEEAVEISARPWRS